MTRLEELCRDRPLVTPEIHSPNDFYGHAQLLRRYAGWSNRAPLKAVIEHGIMFDDFLWDVDLRTRLPYFLCGPSRHAQLYEARSHGRKRAEAIGPLIGYAASFTVDTAPAERTLLAFPAHSTHHVAASFDAEQFADLLEHKGKAYSRVVVCVYWKDYLAGAAAPFERRGFTCTSAGHMYDPAFLFRLVRIIRDATTVVTNEVGTCLLYATLLGRPAWLQRQTMKYASANKVYERDMPAFLSHPNVRRCMDLFSEPRDDISREQRQYVDELTGRASFRKPQELSDLFGKAEGMYRRTAKLTDLARDTIVRGRYLGLRLVDTFGGFRS